MNIPVDPLTVGHSRRVCICVGVCVCVYMQDDDERLHNVAESALYKRV